MGKTALKYFITSLMLGILSIVSSQRNSCNKSWAKSSNKAVMAQFKNIFEASGVQTIGGGRVVVIEDEKKRAISHVLTFGTGEVPREDRLQFDKPSKNILTKLIDLEGIAGDSRGHLFAITSHSHSIKGHLKKSRQQFVRFEIQQNLITDFEQFHFLGNCIRRKIGVNEINIEAISFDENGKKLLIGLREPVLEGKSLIVVLENPNAVFEYREKAKISNQIFRLDLGGGGIRAMDFDQKLGGYVIVNEIKNAQGKLRSAFWFWNGTVEQQPCRISIKGMDNIKNIEGITSVNIDGVPRIFIVSDDGKAWKHKGAHYAILRYDQLVICDRLGSKFSLQ